MPTRIAMVKLANVVVDNPMRLFFKIQPQTVVLTLLSIPAYFTCDSVLPSKSRGLDAHMLDVQPSLSFVFPANSWLFQVGVAVICR